MPKFWCTALLTGSTFARPRVCQNIARVRANGLPVCGLHAKICKRLGDTITELT